MHTIEKLHITLDFDIDYSENFSDDDFLFDDFYGELSCCVNMPIEDSCKMEVQPIIKEIL